MSVSILVDLSSFYEHFDNKELLARADRLGFPSQLTRLALRGYTAPRFIAQQGRLTKPLRAKRGVVAGCGLATTWVKIYCIEAFDKFEARYKGRVRLDAYIDDLTISATADTEDELEILLVEAALELARLIEEDLLCKVATEKTMVISSTNHLKG